MQWTGTAVMRLFFPFTSLVGLVLVLVLANDAMHAECDIVYQLRPLVGLSNAGIVSKPMDITLLTAW